MLDHVFLSVSDIERSIAFYTRVLAPLGITDRVDYDGKGGPPGHPDPRVSAARGASSSGCGLALPIAGRRMSASSRTPGPRSIQPMPQRWRRAPPTMGNQVFGSITIRVTMPATCLTPTATASNLFSTAGSTPSPSRARHNQN